VGDKRTPPLMEVSLYSITNQEISTKLGAYHLLNALILDKLISCDETWREKNEKHH